MKEIRSIINAYNKTNFSVDKAALATLVRVQGSSYRRTGARMLILDNGIYFGGISGGCLEGDILRRAQKAIFKNQSSVITYDTTQDDGHQVGIGLGCNGIIDVLITPLNNKDEDPVNLLSIISGTRTPRVLISIIGSESLPNLLGKTTLFENDINFLSVFPIKEIASDVLKDVEQVLKNNTSETFIYDSANGEVRIFLEVIPPAIRLIIYGSNHDIIPVAIIGKELGWDVILVTNISKANKVLIEKAITLIDNKAKKQLVVDGYTAVVLMAHDYKTDFDNLQEILKTEASYVGLLGPKKRSEKMFDELFTKNILTEHGMERIYAPCGLDIGAETPEEIALSITAEIRAHFAGRKGISLKFRHEKIYDTV